MTSSISNDALSKQQSRIMQALRNAQSQPGNDLRNIARAGLAYSSGKNDYFTEMDNLRQAQAKQDIGVEQGIFEQMKQEADRGNLEAKAINDAITEVAGSDPRIYASLIDDLHNDTEPVNSQNARSKVMKYAAERGIVPLSVQENKAKISKLQSDLVKASREASGEDIGPTGNIIKKIAAERNIPFSQAAYLYQAGFRGDKQYDDNGKIIPIAGSLTTSGQRKAAEEQGKVEGKFKGGATTDLPRIEQQTNIALDLINQLKSHPGLGQAVGLSSAVPIVPGTSAADFTSRLEQIEGQNFLQAFNQLKGGGQITEIEGQKAQNAIARLQRRQSEPEFRKALDDLSDILNKGLERARKSAGSVPSGDVEDNTKKRLKYNPATGEFE